MNRRTKCKHRLAERCISSRRHIGTIGSILIPFLTVLAMGCQPPDPPNPEPSSQDVFEPDPGVLSDADGLVVSIQGQAGKTVCYGGNALVSTDGASCQFGDEVISYEVALTACADQIVKVSFIGNNSTPIAITGVFNTANYSDCDGDDDGIANSVDNCPDDPNTNQADNDDDDIGNVCDDDDDNDGVNDDVDNCPYTANADQDPEACSGVADSDNDMIPDSVDNCIDVWNRDQGDDDGDGVGDVCDTTVVISMPLANDDFAQAFVRWKDQVQCAIRCSDPTGAGNQGTLSCPGGGTANWSVDLKILDGQANSYFTYSACNFTTAEGDHLVVSGQLAQYSDLDGNGREEGSVQVGEGDYVGIVESHTVFHNKNRDGGYFTVGCISDPLPDQICKAAPGMVNVYYPDWTCQNGECDTSPPFVDSDEDGVFDRYDNCPDDSNPDQANSDFDDEGGDACDTPDLVDGDGDLIPDSGDNCPGTANQDQLDTDGDGQGDLCDTYPNDGDNDGYDDDVDNCPTDSNPDQLDNDDDGEGNVCDMFPDGVPTIPAQLVTYGRGVGGVASQSCGDQEMDAGLCYDYCAAGYHGVGPVCWSDQELSYGRDVGTPLESWCDGQEEDAGLCYDYCDDGFHGVGPVCWNDLPGSYGRGVGTIPTNIFTHKCPSGKEYDAGLCYYYCDAGYHGVGPVCWLDTASYGRGVGTPMIFGCPGQDEDAGLCYQYCNTGYTGVGPVCWLDDASYGRGVGTIPDLVCGEGEELDAGLCYPVCEDGYSGVGPVCWAPFEDILAGLITDLTETFPGLADLFN